MPTYRGLTVNITAEAGAHKGEPVKEMGVKNPKAFMKSKTASCYIESVKGMRFGIQIQAETPFPFPSDLPTPASSTSTPSISPGKVRVQQTCKFDTIYHAKVDAKDNERIKTEQKEVKVDAEDNERIKTEPKEDISVKNVPKGESSDDSDDSDSSDGSVRNDGSDGYDDSDGNDNIDWSDGSTVDSTPASEPYNLLVRVYFDGKEQHEVQRYVYVDPATERYWWHHGETKLDYGYTCDRLGQVHKCHWNFRESGGIGSLADHLDSLNLGISAPSDNAADEELANALNSTKLDEKQEASKVGQIKVVFSRIVLDKKVNFLSHRKIKCVEECASTKGDADDSNIAHSAGYSKVGMFNGNRLRPTVRYGEYVPGEEPFATFVFYYRSTDVLRKFGFLDGEVPSSRRLTGLGAPLIKQKRVESEEGQRLKRIKEWMGVDGRGWGGMIEHEVASRDLGPPAVKYCGHR